MMILVLRGSKIKNIFKIEILGMYDSRLEFHFNEDSPYQRYVIMLYKFLRQRLK